MQNLTVIEKPEFESLIKEVNELKELVMELTKNVAVEPEWYSLKEACERKGINYKTTLNCPYLQPNQGTPDGKIGGPKKWKKETIVQWLSMTDEDIKHSRN